MRIRSGLDRLSALDRSDFAALVYLHFVVQPRLFQFLHTILSESLNDIMQIQRKRMIMNEIDCKLQLWS